jgi:hypothetical protein
MAFRGRKSGQQKRGQSGSRSGPQLPSVLRKQIAAQAAEDGSGGSGRRGTTGGKLNHRERRKLEKSEKLQKRQGWSHEQVNTRHLEMG